MDVIAIDGLGQPTSCGPWVANSCLPNQILVLLISKQECVSDKPLVGSVCTPPRHTTFIGARSSSASLREKRVFFHTSFSQSNYSCSNTGVVGFQSTSATHVKATCTRITLCYGSLSHHPPWDTIEWPTNKINFVPTSSSKVVEFQFSTPTYVLDVFITSTIYYANPSLKIPSATIEWLTNKINFVPTSSPRGVKC